MLLTDFFLPSGFTAVFYYHKMHVHSTQCSPYRLFDDYSLAKLVN